MELLAGLPDYLTLGVADGILGYGPSGFVVWRHDRSSLRLAGKINDCGTSCVADMTD